MSKLTPQQQSKLTYQKQILKEQKHMFCPMEVLKRGPHTGLYCAQHGVWIQWISHQDAAKIQDIL
jgi:hypothetical protein